jgi:hypothetical protein
MAQDSRIAKWSDANLTNLTNLVNQQRKVKSAELKGKDLRFLSVFSVSLWSVLLLIDCP